MGTVKLNNIIRNLKVAPVIEKLKGNRFSCYWSEMARERKAQKNNVLSEE